MYTRTPLKISEKVLELCQRIVPGSRPIFLKIAPGAGCKPRECFESVRRKAEREGGRIQYGWALWEWPHAFVEAEHHAVYEPSAGPPWVDLTPCAEGSRQRLFLADDDAPYDFQNEGFRRDNIRLALSEDPDIEEFFKAGKRRSQFYNQLPGVGQMQISGSEQRELEKIERRITRAVTTLAEKYGRGLDPESGGPDREG
jgi:hypothetical protein